VSLTFSRHLNSKIPAKYVWLLGNFDGLHKGHIALINHAKAIAQQSQSAVGLLSFHPHPRMVFDAEKKPITIMQMPQKIRLLAQYGVDHYYAHPFNKDIAQMSAHDFCQKLKQQLDPQHIVIGHDFHFGKNRTGTPHYLSDFCQNNNIGCTIIQPKMSPKNIRYASATMREFLSQGNIDALKQFMDHDYMISGRVQHGKKLARQLGFPTANILPQNLFLPKFGVYKVRVLNRDNRCAIANIGIKPTLNNQHTPLLEVHIPNFDDNLYGEKLHIAFDTFIRPEQKFTSLEALKIQIKNDLKSIALENEM